MEILVEVDAPHYAEARDAIAPFTELVKSPEHVHTYKISHLSLWNAASTGLIAKDILDRLEDSAETSCIGSRTWKITAGAFGCDVYEIVHDNVWETGLFGGSGQNEEKEPDTRGRERRWFAQENVDAQDDADAREDMDYDLDDERRRRIAEMLFPKWKSEFFRLRRM